MSRTQLRSRLLAGKSIEVPQFIGYTPQGQPVFSVAGGAVVSSNIDDWIPVEYDGKVITTVTSGSAIERFATRVVMKSNVKSIPRSEDMDVRTGETYVDDASANDQVLLTARKFQSRITLDEDDMNDVEALLDAMEAKAMQWWDGPQADLFDNACLGVTVAEDVSTEPFPAPFTSAYKTLRTTDSDLSYTADDNYNTWDDDLLVYPETPLGTSLFEKLSASLGLLERSKYWSVRDMLVIASPGWREQLRNVKNQSGGHIFTDNAGNLPGNTTPDTLFQIPIAWSRGCKTSSTNTKDPSGADLLYFVNRQYLKRGDRSDPQQAFSPSRAQDDKDQASVKFRVRRGFALAHPKAASVLERVTD